jgi:hypothetical protein
MNLCYPALTTAALFTAVIINDLIKADYKYILGHFLFGLISLLLMMYLCDSGAEFAAWGVLMLPLILLMLGWSIDSVKKASGKEATLIQPPATPRGPCGCSQCGSCPCICNYKTEKALIDASGNGLDSGVEGEAPSSKTSTSGAAATTATPSAKTESCGPGSTSGKTQCLNTSTLTSA